MIRWLALLVLVCGCSRLEPRTGARVEKAARTMPADVAGLGEGDVIIRWDRGPVTTPFDLLELEMVEAPRGPVTLTVVREGKARSIKLPIGEWRLTARSVLPPELDAIDVQARQALTASRFAEAAGDFERLAKALTDAGRPRDACWALMQVGLTHSKAKQPAEADRAFDEALARARRLPDPIVEAHVLNAFGDDLVNRSDKKSEQIYRDAIALRQKLEPDGLAASASQLRLGHQLRLRGEFKGAEETFELALASRERLVPNTVEHASALSALASSLLQRGDDRAAEPLYLRALKLREPLAAQGAELGSAMGNLGLIAKNRGDLSRAEELYRKNLERFERIDPTAYEVAFPLNFLGNLARINGETSEAEGYYRCVFEIF